MQWPHPENVVNPPAILGEGKSDDENDAGDTPGDERADRVHDIRAGADGHQSSQRAVVHEARVVPFGDQRRQHAAHHGHQRVQRYQPADPGNLLGRHHVEPKPADGKHPGAERQKGNAGGRVGRDPPSLP